MYFSSPSPDLVDVVCLRGHWTLEITRLGLVGGGGVRLVVTLFYCLFVNLYRQRVSANILLLLLLNKLRLYADGGGGGGRDGDVANQIAGFRKSELFRVNLLQRGS